MYSGSDHPEEDARILYRRVIAYQHQVLSCACIIQRVKECRNDKCQNILQETGLSVDLVVFCESEVPGHEYSVDHVSRKGQQSDPGHITFRSVFDFLNDREAEANSSADEYVFVNISDLFAKKKNYDEHKRKLCKLFGSACRHKCKEHRPDKIGCVACRYSE